MKNSKSNKSESTRVICQNCGAEVVIPSHEHQVSGVAIGKDSGLGTVILPTKGGADSAVERLRKIASSDAEMRKLVDEVVAKIYGVGYLDVDGIVRRWIPAQCLAMLNNRSGFHQSLLFRGYDYSWRVLLNDLKAQRDLSAKHDDEGVKDRNRWYNKAVALLMAQHFIDRLEEEMNRLPKRLHGKRQYVRLRCWLNKGKGVHLDEFSAVFATLEKARKKIASTAAPKTLYEAVLAFDKLRRSISFKPSEPCKEFLNAYKAAGAYYTMKDLIMFEGCKMKVHKDGNTNDDDYWSCKAGDHGKFVEQDKSLEALERKADDILRRDVTECGYEMLGLLRSFLSYNNFNYEQTQQEWADQSAARRALRKASQHRRSRK